MKWLSRPQEVEVVGEEKVQLWREFREFIYKTNTLIFSTAVIHPSAPGSLI